MQATPARTVSSLKRRKDPVGKGPVYSSFPTSGMINKVIGAILDGSAFEHEKRPAPQKKADEPPKKTEKTQKAPNESQQIKDSKRKFDQQIEHPAQTPKKVAKKAPVNVEPEPEPEPEREIDITAGMQRYFKAVLDGSCPCPEAFRGIKTMDELIEHKVPEIELLYWYRQFVTSQI